MWIRRLSCVAVCVGLAGARPIEFRDIVEMAEPGAPRISPDGRLIAYTVRQASVANDSSRSGLWIAGQGMAPRRILDEAPVGAYVWAREAKHLMARLPRKGPTAFWRIPVDGGAPRAVVEHAQPVSSAWWAAGGERVLFTSSEPESATEKAQREREGVVYDDTVHGIRSFTRHNWSTPRPVSLWVWREGDLKAERVPWDAAATGAIRDVVWSPDGRRAVVEYAPAGVKSGGNTTHLGLLEGLEAGGDPTFRALVTGPAANRGACWQSGGAGLYFAETGGSGRYFDSASVVRAVNPGTGELTTIASGDWRFLSRVECAPGGPMVEYENQSRSTVYRLAAAGAAADAIGDAAHFSQCSFSEGHRWAACVRQTLTSPPEIARVDLESGGAEVFTRLNPGFAGIELADAVERKWTNRLGYGSNGFLFLPSGYRAGGKRVPLVVIHYHFSTKFTGQAQWMTSYPVQHLVGAGIAVLLHNYPRELGWTAGDFAGASKSQAENPLASMEAAVQALVDEGIADPARIGIAGWSFGAWLAELAITQTSLFRVASAGEGGLNNAGQYWVVGSRGMQDYLDAFFGGPPFGAALANYQKLAPALNAHRVTAPLLREYGPDVGVQSLEFYMALRRLGKPVEQVIYPGAPHIFDRPAHRMASMERNLDWFRFWLQDYEDPAPGKVEQYRRWRTLREME